jgi:hypothetical protein
MFNAPKREIMQPMILVLTIFMVLGLSMEADRYVYSQSSSTNSTASTSGVNLINTHTSPLHLKSGSKFEIFSTVINSSPGMISFVAGTCDSPLFAHFANNVVIKQTQGCTATSPPFKLNPGEEVSVAGPGSGTIYQAVTPGQTKGSVTFHYQVANGQDANVTKPFVFTIS